MIEKNVIIHIFIEKNMDKKSLTSELERVLSHAKSTTIKDYPHKKITVRHFVYSIFESPKCEAYKAMTSISLSIDRDKVKNEIEKLLTSNVEEVNPGEEIKFEDKFDDCLNVASKISGGITVNSLHLLISVIRADEKICDIFRTSGIEENQLLSKDKRVKHGHKPIPIKFDVDDETEQTNNQVEKDFENINQMAEKGKIRRAVCVDEIISEIFTVLLRHDYNNVMLIGGNSSGKTTIARHIANLIVERNVPLKLKNRMLINIDILKKYANLVADPMTYPHLIKTIFNADKLNKYIFLIDNIGDNLLYFDYRRVMEICTLSTDIPLICTSSESDFNKFSSSTPNLAARFHVIRIDEKTDDEYKVMINCSKCVYEDYHNVMFNDEMVNLVYDKCKKYFKNNNMPGIAIEMIDEIGAFVNKNVTKEDKLSKLERKMQNVTDKIKECIVNNDTNKLRDLEEKEIKIRTEINEIEKKNNLSDNKIVITKEDVLSTFSLRLNIPSEDINKEEFEKLRNIENKLNETVIGQKEAVSKLSRAVKRHRVGLNNTDKPSVFMFVGYSGCGKTYLAKKLSEILYDKKNSFIRLDMSEYSDKVSATKLYGTSPGYVGYEDGGILTKALKNKNGCVLLLDEMEKANDDVFNVFLQIFDEGRLTDNKGNSVNFSDVIVIMTSNVGVREAMERGNGIGFTKDETLGESIIRERLKHKFSPEFLNRIDSIVMFNKLSEDDITRIIEIEVGKICDNLIKNGYKYDESFKNKSIEIVKESHTVNDKNGARPIIRLIQSLIEDRITDYIIDNGVQKGFIFTDNIF